MLLLFIIIFFFLKKLQGFVKLDFLKSDWLNCFYVQIKIAIHIGTLEKL